MIATLLRDAYDHPVGAFRTFDRFDAPLRDDGGLADVMPSERRD